MPAVAATVSSGHGDDDDSGMTRPIGDLLREWRERRRLSQLALALDAEVSTRHLSFLETGTGAAEPGDAVAAGGAAGGSAARTQHDAARGGIRPRLPRARSRRPRAGSGAGGSRPGAGRARAVPRARGRSLLDAGRRQPRRAGAADRRGARSPAAADQRPAPQPPPGRVGGADRESPRVASASPGAIVSPGGAHRRSAAIGSAPGAAWLCRRSRHAERRSTRLGP